jgi:hypothetical protein
MNVHLISKRMLSGTDDYALHRPGNPHLGLATRGFAGAIEDIAQNPPSVASDGSPIEITKRCERMQQFYLGNSKTGTNDCSLSSLKSMSERVGLEVCVLKL